MTAPFGYTFDDPSLPASPVTREDLERLEATLLWTESDERALRRAGEVLSPRIEEVLDLWYGYVGSQPHLVATFAGRDGAPDERYLSAVRARFGQWIRDLCARDRDERWLAYQHEIALRHHRAKKNETDGVESASDHVPLRYLVAFIWPITATVRDFLASGSDDAEEVDAMHRAWFKAVTLSVALWAQPYSPDLW